MQAYIFNMVTCDEILEKWLMETNQTRKNHCKCILWGKNIFLRTWKIKKKMYIVMYIVTSANCAYVWCRVLPRITKLWVYILLNIRKSIKLKRNYARNGAYSQFDLELTMLKAKKRGAPWYKRHSWLYYFIRGGQCSIWDVRI